MGISHTPGEWKPICLDETFSESPVWSVDNGCQAVATIWGATPEEAEGNARIVAAAPEMLEACTRAEWWLSTVEGSEAIRKVLQDAIKKAKGEK